MARFTLLTHSAWPYLAPEAIIALLDKQMSCNPRPLFSDFYIFVAFLLQKSCIAESINLFYFVRLIQGVDCWQTLDVHLWNSCPPPIMSSFLNQSVLFGIPWNWYIFAKKWQIWAFCTRYNAMGTFLEIGHSSGSSFNSVVGHTDEIIDQLWL